MSTPADIIDAKALAERWSVSTDLVYTLAREGKLPRIPLPSRVVRFRLDQIERYERGEWPPNGNGR